MILGLPRIAELESALQSYYAHVKADDMESWMRNIQKRTVLVAPPHQLPMLSDWSTVAPGLYPQTAHSLELVKRCASFVVDVEAMKSAAPLEDRLLKGEGITV